MFHVLGDKVTTTEDTGSDNTSDISSSDDDEDDWDDWDDQVVK